MKAHVLPTTLPVFRVVCGCILDDTWALRVPVCCWCMWSLKKKHVNVRLFEFLVPLMSNQPVVTLHMNITLSRNTSGMFFQNNHVLVRV